MESMGRNLLAKNKEIMATDSFLPILLHFILLLILMRKRVPLAEGGIDTRQNASSSS